MSNQNTFQTFAGQQPVASGQEQKQILYYQDPLLSYQAQAMSRDFLAPSVKAETRKSEQRRNLSPSLSQRLLVLGDFNSERKLSLDAIGKYSANVEIQNVIKSERLFLALLALMTSVLGAITVYFVLNLSF